MIVSQTGDLIFHTDFENITKTDDHHLSIPIDHNFYFQGEGGASMWMEGLDRTGGPTPHSGSRCVGMELFDIDLSKRNEFDIEDLYTTVGDEIFVSAWLYFESNLTLLFPEMTWGNYFEFVSLFKECNKPHYRPYLCISLCQFPDYAPQQFDLEVRGRHLDGTQYTLDRIHNFSIPLGRWFNVKFYLSRHKTDGVETIWIDDVLISNRTGIVTKVLIDNYLIQVGKIYHSFDDHTHRKIWIDDLEIYKGTPT